jgi:hypothetical protein
MSWIQGSNWCKTVHIRRSCGTARYGTAAWRRSAALLQRLHDTVVYNHFPRLMAAHSLVLLRHRLSRYSNIFGLKTADLQPEPKIDPACTLKKEDLREPPCARGRCISIPKHAYDSVALSHNSVAFASPFESWITRYALPKRQLESCTRTFRAQ